MAIHSRTIAWKIPWTEEPGRLQPMGSQRVGHDWVTSLSLLYYLSILWICSHLFSLYQLFQSPHSSMMSFESITISTQAQGLHRKTTVETQSGPTFDALKLFTLRRHWAYLSLASVSKGHVLFVTFGTLFSSYESDFGILAVVFGLELKNCPSSYFVKKKYFIELLGHKYIFCLIQHWLKNTVLRDKYVLGTWENRNQGTFLYKNINQVNILEDWVNMSMTRIEILFCLLILCWY